MRASRTAVLIAVAVILVASAAVRLYRLDQPRGYIFDEVYYAKDAKTIIDGRMGPKEGYQWMPGDEVSWPHPYYGKLAIAVGILLFGDDELGWRFVPALAGLAALLLVFPLARRLGLRREWALLALVLAAADLLGIAQSRIATLDVFVGLWSVLTIYLTLRYVQSGGRLLWLALAGVSGGLAFGTKWSGAYACLASLVLILVLWRRRGPAVEPAPATALLESGGEEAAANGRRTDRSKAANGRRVTVAARSRVAAVLLPLAFLILVPVGLYAASYGFYFVAGHGLNDWWHLHREMWTFNTHLSATHTYASQAPTWVLDIRPVWYHFKEHAAHYYGVVAMGHPLVWWAAALAFVTLPLMAILDRRRELVLPSLIIALLYFPWFAASRTSFLYYMTPVAPFLAILVAAGLARLAGQPPGLDGDSAPDVALAGDPAGAFASSPDRLVDASGRTAAFADESPPAAAFADGSHLLRASGAETPADLESRIDRRSIDRTDSGAVSAIVYGLAAFLATAAVTALLWWPIGRALAYVFYEIPARVAPVVGIAVASVVGALAIAALVWLATRPRLTSAWRYLAWAFTGAVVGFAVVFAPIVLDIPISPDDFYRLMWLPTWI